MTKSLPIVTIKIVDYDPSRAMETVRMWRASMEQALGVKDPHSLDGQAAYLRSLAEKYSVYLALDEAADAVVGLMVVGDTELDQLYVHVDYQGMGVGTRLLNLAKRLSPGTLQCYTFAVNDAGPTVL